MNGQSFAFHGYLPIERKEKQQKLRALEKESKQKDQTQILWIHHIEMNNFYSIF